MGKFNPYAQENMYRMDEEPPKMEMNDYIVEYKRTGDDYWLACFLHRFEQEKLNGWVYSKCKKHSQHSRFKDIKQEAVRVLLEKLDEYDPTVGTTLWQFTWHDIKNAFYDYMRKNVGIYLLSDKYYQALRKVNYIYYRNDELSYDERIQTVITKTGFKLEKVLRYIDDANGFGIPKALNQI